MKNEIIIFHESVLKSWLKDIWTFGTLTGVIALNYFLFDNNGVVAFLVIIFWFIWVITSASTKDNKFYSKESAIKYIKEL